MMNYKATISLVFLLCIGVPLLGNEPTPDVLAINDSDWQEMSALMRFLRSEKQDQLFIPVAKLQLAYLQDAITKIESDDPQRAVEIRRFARGVAYNIASFTWPGWADSQEPISSERQALGLAAARQAVALAEKINEPTPNAYWILGAHSLNSALYTDALESFERAEELARNDFYRAMNAAWQQFVRAVALPSEDSRTTLQTAIDQLRDSDDSDADFFADQLVTAQSVYLDVDD